MDQLYTTVANIIAIPIFVNLNIYLDILRCTLSVNLNTLIINSAKLVIQLI